MRVAAVVVTYNRKAFLLECVEALLQQTYPLDEIVIFDNASTDGTEQALIDAGFISNRIITYVRHESNSGGAGGFYYGSKEAYIRGADWIWMMDDDCIPSSTALAELIAAASIVDAGYLCSAVYDLNGEPCNKPSVNPSDPWYNYLQYGIVRISRATFVSYLVPREAVEQCGLPYKNYFIWGDDDEYCFRLTKFFRPGYFVGRSLVTHKVKKNPSPWDSDDPRRIKMAHYMVRNTLLNTKEYGTFSQKIKKRFNDARTIAKIFFSRRKKKILKIEQMLLGTWEFHIGTYNRKEFKKRFQNQESD